MVKAGLGDWLKKKGSIFFLLAGLVAVAVWGVTQHKNSIVLRNQLENGYQQLFYSLVSSVENIDVLIAKGLVSTSPPQSILLFSQTWREAFSAQEKLNQLPIEHVLVARTAKFLTQVGDFSYAVAKQIADGQDITPEQRATLRSLQSEADYLTRELHGLRNQIKENKFAWGEITREGAAKFREVSPDLAEVSFREIDSHMQGLPVLIYDGPFSDHMDRLTPRSLGGPEIGPEEAVKRAQEMADLIPGLHYTASAAGTGEGKIPFHRVYLVPTGGSGPDDITVDISRQGGLLISLVNARPLGEAALTKEQALEKAVAYVKQKGFPSLIPTFTQLSEGAAIISFAGFQDGVILYPDQVKIKVALDNGQVIGVENTDYLMSHYDRKFPAPRITADWVRKKASSTLKVENVQLALIPLNSKREVFCYEARGTFNEEDYFIYFNALTGAQEMILKVIKTEQGPLTL